MDATLNEFFGYFGAPALWGGIFCIIAVLIAAWIYRLSHKTGNHIDVDDEDRTPRAVLAAIVVALVMLLVAGKLIAPQSDRAARILMTAMPIVAATAIVSIQLARSIMGTRSVESKRERQVAISYEWMFAALFTTLCVLAAIDMWSGVINPPPYRFFMPGFAVLLFAFNKLGLLHRAAVRASIAEYHPTTHDRSGA